MIEPILAVVAFLGNPFQASVSTSIAGAVMILGGISYRSAKKRRLGQVKETPMRRGVELTLLAAILVIILFQNNLIDLIESDPVPNLIIPVWALLAYFIELFRHRRS